MCRPRSSTAPVEWDASIERSGYIAPSLFSLLVTSERAGRPRFRCFTLESPGGNHFSMLAFARYLETMKRRLYRGGWLRGSLMMKGRLGVARDPELLGSLVPRPNAFHSSWGDPPPTTRRAAQTREGLAVRCPGGEIAAATRWSSATSLLSAHDFNEGRDNRIASALHPILDGRTTT